MEEDATGDGWQAGILLSEGEEPGSRALRSTGSLRDFRGASVKLAPGPHRIELAHSGFLPYRAEVAIESGKVRRLHVEMGSHRRGPPRTARPRFPAALARLGHLAAAL